MTRFTGAALMALPLAALLAGAAAGPADAAPPRPALENAIPAAAPAPLRSRSDAAAALRAHGYRYVRRVQRSGSAYVADGYDRIGNRVRLRIDARTGAVTPRILGGSVTPVVPLAQLPAVPRPHGNNLHIAPPGGSYYHGPVVDPYRNAAGLPLRPSAIPNVQRCGVLGALCR